MNGRTRRLVLRVAGPALCLVAGLWLLARAAGAQHAPSQQDAPAASAGVPAVVTRAARQDVPIYVEGVGTVQAYQDVLVRARVDGTLESVPVTEGQSVKQGDLIAVIDPRPYRATLDQAMAKKAQDEAQLANARLDLTRYASLAKQDFASRQQLDTQQALVNQYTGAIAGDNAAIEAAQLNLAFCYITAPVAGRIGLRLVDPGNLIHATDTTGIISITQIHPISAVFTLAQDELPRVQDAMRSGTLSVLAYASDDRTLLGQGTLLTANNSINISTGTIELKATFPNTDDRLWPGQFINAHLQIGVDRNAVTVPTAAIQHGPDGLFVYLVKPDSTASVQPVSVSYQTASLAVVSQGLSGGENVVVDGQSRLQTGTRVAATSAAKPS